MPLTKLELDGFKSFAEKTTIHFNTGITGIVGPNGSGKSNITEAIRWVMGESSAKSLRGSNMKDVIFAGSEFRKPAAHAEVALTFSNKKRELNFDSDEVMVTRRILRSGESEYLINRQNVRLRDVQALFLDSGISQNSLAIISQGRVDQILNSKAEERRAIFEEAAGVLHFKKQKQTSQIQLEQTNDNLVRINDLVKELASRIEPLKEQSSLAREYQFQQNGLDKQLKTLLAFEISDLDQKKSVVQEKATQSKALLAKLDREVTDSQAAVTAKKGELQELVTRRDEIQKTLLTIADKSAELSTNLQVTEQSKQYSEATKKEYQKELAQLEKENLASNSAIVDLSKTKEQLTKKQEELEKNRAQLNAELKENPTVLSKNLEKLRNGYIELLQKQTSNNNQIVYLNAELKRSSDDSRGTNDDLAQQLKESTKILQSLRQQGQELTKKRQIQIAEIANLETQQTDLQKELSESQKQVNKIQQELQRLLARYEALKNIQKRHDGYYYGVRNVLNNLAEYPGVVGVIGELISFRQELSAAMTTALGGGVQDIVTKTRLAARDAINKLKGQHAGRATFLPLDGLHARKIPTSTVIFLKSFPGFKGVASDLVTINSEIDIKTAIDYLLASTIIVDSIDTALKVSRKIGRYRIITLDGDVISPGGSMTGGARNQKNNSPLQTTTELASLKKQGTSLKEKLGIEQAKLTQISQKNENVSLSWTTENKKLQQTKQTLGEVLVSFQNQEKEVKRLTKANELFINRQAEHEQQILQIKKDMQSANEEKVSLAQKTAQEKEKIKQLQNKIADFTSLSKNVQEQLAKLEPQIAVLTNKLENIAKQLAEKNAKLAADRKQVKILTAKITEIEQNGELSQKKKVAMKNEHDELSVKQTKLEQELKMLSSKSGQFDAQINKLDQVASRNYDLRKDAAAEQEALSVQLAKFTSEIDQRLESLRTKYSLTYEAALNEATGPNNDETRQKLQKDIKLHQLSLADIGPVNLQSITEYEDVKKRYDFLSTQQNDLLQAREDIEKTMATLDKEVEKRFSHTFSQISENFTELFPLVFAGGNAKLVLTDPDNLLTTGVDIVAQPPGKKLQKLSLLSGGERALTAITLLFAILKAKPVPFCVLDEVEAALDDANVVRFAHFLEKYDLKTQFVVITHRRGTMEQADQLYGVVMQESGVSQVLSVSLKNLDNEVE